MSKPADKKMKVFPEPKSMLNPKVKHEVDLGNITNESKRFAALFAALLPEALSEKDFMDMDVLQFNEYRAEHERLVMQSYEKSADMDINFIKPKVHHMAAVEDIENISLREVTLVASLVQMTVDEMLELDLGVYMRYKEKVSPFLGWM